LKIESTVRLATNIAAILATPPLPNEFRLKSSERIVVLYGNGADGGIAMGNNDAIDGEYELESCR
jgi:hypothetical protein